jgi:4-amino-4-deoxy-L-arabinose transferase-like glycosyltransferase
MTSALRTVTAGWLALRLVAANKVGFGDSEALYASYALHPQPGYLDHPGLVGLFARAIGSGSVPTPERAHLFTAVLSVIVPLAMAALCGACGATPRRAAAAALVFAFVPEIAVGLFALTPDLLLAPMWIGSLTCAAIGLRATPRSVEASFALAAAGLLAGAATAAKVSGALLIVALVVTYLAPRARAHARSVAPWAGLLAGAVVLYPVVVFEQRTGWPMVTHRLVDTQHGSGLSLRNLGVLFGGQLAYLSPVVAVLAAMGAREAWRSRHDEDPIGPLLWWAFVIPFVVLVALCAWSRAAEPHWLAPALLPLVPALARSERLARPRWIVAGGLVAAGMSLSIYAWVLVPELPRIAPVAAYPEDDISNELYGWPQVIREVRRQAEAQATPVSARGDVVVVGPHWVICAQLEAALRGETPVGCDTPVRDDFDTWWPRDRWQRADAIVWVTDARFGPPPTLPSHALLRTAQVRVMRGGRVARLFSVATFASRSQG